MLILSRHRVETPQDTELAEAISERFGVSVLSIPFVYDLRSSSRIFQRLKEIDKPFGFLAPFPVRVSKNLLVEREIVKETDAIEILDVESLSVEDVLRQIGHWPFSVSETESHVERLDEPTVKRWYPVLDEAKCTGCLECVNFCLFGVYAIGTDDRPFVDQPDACRDGCPACSRVCPGAAILFPTHEDPDISGRNSSGENRRLPGDGIRTADAERRYFVSQKDDLDELVDQVDRFIP